MVTTAEQLQTLNEKLAALEAELNGAGGSRSRLLFTQLISVTLNCFSLICFPLTTNDHFRCFY